MKFVKSNHRATLRNKYFGELIRTALTTCCPDFRRLANQTYVHLFLINNAFVVFQLLQVILCKTCILNRMCIDN